MSERSQSKARSRDAWHEELRAIASLSWPLALTNLAQIGMGTTDVLMMGWVGPETLAAGALGTNLYFIVMIFGIGLINAVPPMIAQALGRDPNARADVRRTVQQGFWVSLLVTVLALCVLWWSEAILLAMGQAPTLAAEAGRYVRVLQWSLPPFFAYLVLRSFVAALERPVWPLVISLLAVLVNAAGNWCLMLGRCGFEPLGIAGSGLATVIATTFMLVALSLVVSFDQQFARFEVLARWWRADRERLSALLRLGLPLAATLSFEVTIFNAAVFLMGLIDAAALAAHAIAIQLAALSFMVPLGIGQAATVRVGLAYGAADADAVQRAGAAALLLAVSFMTAMSLLMIALPGWLIHMFIDTSDPANAEVVALARSFLVVAALFQIADGTQAVGSGMLRGLKDVRVPMLFALLGYWGIGLPLGVVLGFPMRFGGLGIWIGLAAGLTTVAGLMMWRWSRREALALIGSRNFRAEP